MIEKHSKQFSIMQSNTNKVKRKYNCKDSEMLIGASVITDSGLQNVQQLEEADTSYNTKAITALHNNIDTAIRDILGADNAAALRQKSIDLTAKHEEALQNLSLTKVLIENKYSKTPVRRDELLTNLGFTPFYKSAAKGTQEAMGHLLSRFDFSLTPILETELLAQGLPPARIKALRALAAVYTTTNVQQEGTKNNRSILTDDNINTLNDLYDQIIALCKMGQRVFAKGTALHDSYVFGQVVARQSSYNAGKENEEETPKSAS
jgi:hypothetical protein